MLWARMARSSAMAAANNQFTIGIVFKEASASFLKKRSKKLLLN
jgi:hypothetical protein